MRRLYTLQQRLAITSAEASALLFVSALLLTGFCVRYVQGQSVPYSAADYAELHAAFEERSESTPVTVTSDSASDSDQMEPARAEPIEIATGSQQPPRRAASGPVRMDLNTASAQTLQRLPGIGPAISARIIDYREAHGGFSHPREVVRVKGIGPKTYQKMAPYLFVEEADGE